MPRQPDRPERHPRRRPDPDQGGRRRGVAGARRSKLEPQLSLLLGLHAAGKLEEIREREITLLGAVEQKIRAVQRRLGVARVPTERRALEVELEERRRELFAPLTSGIHWPGDRRSLASRRTRFTEPFLSGLVLLTRPDRRLLEDIDPSVRVRNGSGSVFTVDVPLRLVPELESKTFVRYIELSRPVFPNIGKATQLAGFVTTRAGDDAGAGVIIGVIDDYLDVYHPDFNTDAGTRVLFLWDQTGDPALAGRTGPPLDPVLPGFMLREGRTATYGVEYDATAIDKEIADSTTNSALKYKTVLHVPADSHGTAVTGCAAGNGRAWEEYMPEATAPELAAVGTNLKGAAPEADIIFVRHGTIDGTTMLGDSADILDAFTYIFARAKEAQKDCVINLSDSDNQGPHDGTSLGEQYLNGLLTEPGRAITLSAGNSTTTFSHAKGKVPANGSIDLEFAYIANSGKLPSCSDAIEIWSPNGTALRATLTGPGGVTMAPETAPEIVPGPAISQTFDGIEVSSTSGQDERNLDNLIKIVFVLTGTQTIPVGTWNIHLANDTGAEIPFDAWIDRNNRGFSRWQSSIFLTAGDLETTLGVPSTAKGPITVGAHDKSTPPDVSTIGFESSGLGPTRKDHGTYKPDLAAVGVQVIAPYPKNLSPGDPFPYKSQSGTSFSAPIVAGACAILFNTEGKARGKELTCEDLRSILTAKAEPAMPATLATPNEKFGHGPLRM